MIPIQNYGLLNPKPSEPSGYVTKDGMWAVVPFGKQFMIIHNGYQVHTVNRYNSAVSYIEKEVNILKGKIKGPLDKFL